MPDYITRAEFETFRQTLISPAEYEVTKRDCAENRAEIAEVKKAHYELRDDVRDYQASKQTQSEVLAQKLKPIFIRWEPLNQEIRDLWTKYKVAAGVVVILSPLLAWAVNNLF